MIIDPALVQGALDYSAYCDLMKQCVLEGRTTGKNQSEEYVEYTRVNIQRMKRVDKTIVLNADLLKLVLSLKHDYMWYVLTEAWCGDAAQCVPVMNAVAQSTPHITLKLLLRDDHEALMSHFLTNGARSIPKLICTDSKGEVVFTWGPRPAALQQIVQDLLAKGVTKAEKGIATQGWYNKDATLTMQRELADLITVAENS